jgi:hypothetical protein
MSIGITTEGYGQEQGTVQERHVRRACGFVIDFIGEIKDRNCS